MKAPLGATVSIFRTVVVAHECCIGMIMFCLRFVCHEPRLRNLFCSFSVKFFFQFFSIFFCGPYGIMFVIWRSIERIHF